jgi:hypothetical protein
MLPDSEVLEESFYSKPPSITDPEALEGSISCEYYKMNKITREISKYNKK